VLLPHGADTGNSMGRSLPIQILEQPGESPLEIDAENTGQERRLIGNGTISLTYPHRFSQRAGVVSSGTSVCRYGKKPPCDSGNRPGAKNRGTKSPKLKLDRYSGACQAH